MQPATRRWKTATSATLLAIKTQNIIRKQKWIILQRQDYSSVESLTKWLNLAQELINDHESKVDNLLQFYHTSLNLVKSSLAEETSESKETKLKDLLSKLASKKLEVEQYLTQNNFLITQLNSLATRTAKPFADSNWAETEMLSQLEQVLTDNAELINKLQTTLTTLNNNHSQVSIEEINIKQTLETSLSPQILNEITLDELTIKVQYLETQNQQLHQNESQLINDKLIAEETLQAQLEKTVDHHDNLSEEQLKRKSLTEKLLNKEKKIAELKEELERAKKIWANRNSHEATINNDNPLVEELTEKLSLKEQQIRELEEKLVEEEETEEQILGVINNYLINIKKKWTNHLDGTERNYAYEPENCPNNEEYLSGLLPLLENILINNNLACFQLFLEQWKTDYPHWQDGLAGDKIWLEYYVNYYQKFQEESQNPVKEKKRQEIEDLKDKVVELEVEKKTLEESLVKAKQVVKDKNKEWAKLNERSSKDLEKAVKAKDIEYKKFINPKNKEILEKTAKDELEMSTKEEVEEAVNEVKIPLQVWETTFLNKTAQQVVEIQKQLQAEKSKLNEEKMELIKNREKLATERRQFLTDLKTVESQFKIIKEEREALEEEKETYLNGFDKAKDETGKFRDEIARLKAIIYDLGIDPNEGKEENDSSAEDDDSTELKSNSSSAEKTKNDNSDNEETKSLNSIPRSDSPINSKHSDNEVSSQTSHKFDEEDEEQEQQDESPKVRSNTPTEEQLLSENDEEKSDQGQISEAEETEQTAQIQIETKK